MEPEILAIMIPIIAIIAGMFLAYYGMKMRQHQQDRMFDERKIAMEKGIPVPPIPQMMKNPVIAHKNASIVNRKGFVILFFLGLAFLFFMPHEAKDAEAQFVGGALIMISLALLVNSFIKFKLSPEEKRMMDSFTDYGDQLSPHETDNFRKPEK